MDDLRNWLAPKAARLTSVTAEDRALGERPGNKRNGKTA